MPLTTIQEDDFPEHIPPPFNTVMGCAHSLTLCSIDSLELVAHPKAAHDYEWNTRAHGPLDGNGQGRYPYAPGIDTFQIRFTLSGHQHIKALKIDLFRYVAHGANAEHPVFTKRFLWDNPVNRAAQHTVKFNGASHPVDTPLDVHSTFQNRANPINTYYPDKLLTVEHGPYKLRAQIVTVEPNVKVVTQARWIYVDVVLDDETIPLITATGEQVFLVTNVWQITTMPYGKWVALAEDTCGIARAKYFYAGMAYPFDTALVFGYEPTITAGVAGSANPYDTGCAAWGKAHPFALDRPRIVQDLGAPHGPRVLALTNATKKTPQNWRKGFAKYRRDLWTSRDRFFRGDPPDKVSHEYPADLMAQDPRNHRPVGLNPTPALPQKNADFDVNHGLAASPLGRVQVTFSADWNGGDVEVHGTAGPGAVTEIIQPKRTGGIPFKQIDVLRNVGHRTAGSVVVRWGPNVLLGGAQAADFNVANPVPLSPLADEWSAVFSPDWDGGAIHIEGLDDQADAKTEDLAPAATTVQGSQQFDTITRVRNLGHCTAGTVDVKWGAFPAPDWRCWVYEVRLHQGHQIRQGLIKCVCSTQFINRLANPYVNAPVPTLNQVNQARDHFIYMRDNGFLVQINPLQSPQARLRQELRLRP